MAVVEALLDQLASEQNVWEYLDTIQHRYRVPAGQRQHFYEQYITLVAMRPQAEQDALITAGQPVFRYRVDTARRDVAALRQTSGDTIKIAPTVVGDDFIAEIIHVPTEATSVKYLIYHADGSTEVGERVQIGNITYMPPQTRLVETGTLLLPTGVDDYGETTMDLIRDVRAFIMQYLYLENAQFRNIAAYYVMLSWIYDRFDVVPYLRAQGEFGTGKTRLLQVVGALSYRGIFAGGATTASPIFRIIERFHGTLVIDEADFNDRSELWSEITKILNTGYQRGFPVLRSERKASNDQYDAESYDCYGPKLLSTRKRFNDQALESRCLSHTMQLSPVPPTVPLFLGAEFREQARVMRNKLLLWRFRKYRTATADPCERFDGLDPRLNQMLLPLLAVADDERMRASILEHTQRYQLRLREDRRDSWEGKIAYCLLESWKKRPSANRVLMKAVNERVKLEFEELKVDPRRVSELIRHAFGLTTIHSGGMVWIVMDERDVVRLADRYAIGKKEFEPLPSRKDTAALPPGEQRALPPASTTSIVRTPVR